jgi:hypothetical protein
MRRLKTSSLIPLYLLLFGAIISGLSCGGSSGTENPVRVSDEEDDDELAPQAISQAQSLKINVKVSETAVQPGETVTVTATVEPIRGTNVLFNWVNVTGYGTLPETNGNSVIWTAPATLETAQVKVEVIQLIVTAISQIVSVKESGVDTDTEVLTATKTILITVTN